MSKQHMEKHDTNLYKGKIYRRKSEALSEFNITLPEQPLSKPKDHD